MLFVHEICHILTYVLFVLIAKGLFPKFFSRANFFMGLLVTFFVDLDHLVDYFLYAGARFNLVEFLSGAHFAYNNFTIVPLHGWEYVLIALVYFLLQKHKKKYSWVLYLAIGLGAHLVFDTLSYGFPWYVYFILYRAYRGFSPSAFW